MNEQELNIFVGNKIREYRKKKNLTQKELGDRIGVKHNTISSYEKGINAPEQNTLFKIARTLDVRVDDLFPPTSEIDVAEEFERALTKVKHLGLKDIQFLRELIEKTLSLDKNEREKFLESIKFTVEYFEKMKKD